MPEKLYYIDSHMKAFTATVTSCEKNGDRFEVTLDRTAFFPEGGGQLGDSGVIGGVRVFDTHEKNGEIKHYVNQTLETGKTYDCAIDWETRFRRMQNHSGEHIVSGLVHKKYGYNNVGFHMGSDFVTIDFDGELSWEQLLEIERDANRAVAANYKVTATFPAEDVLKTLEYRSKLELTENVRIVEIENTDICACCAPHVKRTGEIGMLKVMNYQNYKGGVRISILCGFRALEAFRQKCDIISELMGIFTTNQEAIVDNVTKLKAVNQSLKSAKSALLDYKVAELPADTDNAVLFEDGIDTNTARNCVNGLVEKYSGFSAFFTGNDEAGYSFIIGSKNADCNTVAAALRNKLGARGGGKPVMVQGSVKAAKSEIEEVLKEVL